MGRNPTAAGFHIQMTVRLILLLPIFPPLHLPLELVHFSMNNHTGSPDVSKNGTNAFIPQFLGELATASAERRSELMIQLHQLAGTFNLAVELADAAFAPPTSTPAAVESIAPMEVDRTPLDAWHSIGHEHTSEAEVTLYATSMVDFYFDEAVRLQSWIRLVLQQEGEYDRQPEAWMPPKTWASGSDEKAMLAKALSRYEPRAARCARVLACFDGPGATDGELPSGVIDTYLRHLTNDKSRSIAGPKHGKCATARHFYAAIRVAKRLRSHGVAIRTAVQAVREEAPPPQKTKVEMEMERMQTERQQMDKDRAAEKEKQQAEKAAAKTKDAHRKLKERGAGVRKEERAKAAASLQSRMSAITEKAEEKAVQQLGTERDAALAKAANDNRLRNAANARARVAVSVQEKAEQLAEDRLTAKRKAEAEVEELKQDREETHDQLAASAAALTKLAQIPTFIPLRGAGMGRGALRHPPVMYALGMTQLAAAVSPSAVPSLVVNAVKTITPWATVVAPTVDWVRRLRRMLPIACEALGAYRIGKAMRVAQLGSDATSRSGGAHKGRVPLMTAGVVCDFENSDGSTSRAAVVSRAAYVTPGETAAIEVDAVAKGAFENGQHHLTGWREVHEQMFPVAKGHMPHSIPEPKSASLHRLAGGLLITDTCTGALCFRRLMIALIAKKVEEHIGEADWMCMSEEERQEAVKMYEVDCFGHLRNLQLDAGATAVSAYLKAQLDVELATVPSIYRINTDGMDPIRTVYKQFSRDGAYAKGDGLDFGAWLVSDRPKALYLPIQRSTGGRQDLVCEGAISVYMNRGFYDDFLHQKLHDPEHANLLEDHLWIELTSPVEVAMLRCNAIIGYAVSMPFRFLAGSAHKLKDWSPFKMALVMDVLEQFMERAAADGRLLLSANVNIFEAIEKQQPAFATWRHRLEDEKVVSPDSMVRHHKWQEVRHQLFAPDDETNRASTALTRKLLEVYAQGVLDKMRDPKLAHLRYLSSQDGERAWTGAHATETAAAHAATIGLLATNDMLAESTFGTFTYYFNSHKGISVAAASGVAQARINGDFKRIDNCVRQRKSKKQKAASGEEAAQPAQPLWSEGDRGMGEGLFHNLAAEEQASLVEYARRELGAATMRDKAIYARLLAYCAEKRREFLAKAEVKLQERYIDALYYFEQYHSEGCPKSSQELERDWAWVKAIESSTAQTEWLKDQILTRVVGFGWSDFKCAWSKKGDSTVGSIPTLIAHLRKIVAAEATRPIQIEAHCPTLKRKTLPQLGNPTIKVEELDARAGSQSAAFKAAAVREKAARESQGIGDKWQNAQPTIPPSFNASLVNEQLEICVQYDLPREEGGGTTFLWCPCKVLQVSDGTVRKISEKTGKTVSGYYPVGWVLVRWAALPDLGEPEETEQWIVLDKKKWKGDQKNAWRKNLEEESWLA